MIEKIKQSFVRYIAGTHVAGPHLSDGIAMLFTAQERGWETTLSVWKGVNSPEETAEEYCSILNVISKMGKRSTLSLKPSLLKFDFSLLKKILYVAKDLDIRLHFDAEEPRSASESLALFERAFSKYEKIGYTLPARWRRSFADAEKIIDMQVPVRIIKGQWNGEEGACKDVQQKFLQLAEMFAGYRNTVAIATHDKTLARESLTRLAATGAPCELEQMFGLPWIKADDKINPIAQRMYIPYGYAYLPYNISFVNERPNIIGWIIRDCILGREKKKQLLKLSRISAAKFSEKADRSTENRLRDVLIEAEEEL